MTAKEFEPTLRAVMSKRPFLPFLIEYSDGFGRRLQTRSQAEDTVFGDPVFGDAGLGVTEGDLRCL